MTGWNGTRTRSDGSAAGVDLDRKAFRTAAWVGIGLLALAVIVAMVMGKWWGALALVAFLAASVGFVAFEDRLPALFDLLFVIAALVNALGWVFNLFTRLPGYDEAAHAYTIFAITLSLGFLTYHSVRAEFRTRGALYVLAIASFGLAIGALWEIFEWFVLKRLADPVSDLMMETRSAP